MKKISSKAIVLTIAAVAVIAAAIAVFSYFNRFEYNEAGAIGNTAGNLNNGGLFCEYNDRIYFSNPYNYGKLYSMNPDCTDVRKVSEDTVAYINVYGDYIYYVRNNSKQRIASVFRGYLTGVYRCRLNGRNPKALYNEPSGAISLCGNYIYYQHYDTSNALTLYKAKIDGKENVKVSDNEYIPSSYYDGKIYFANISQNHNIYTMNINNNDAINTYLEANAYMVDMEGQFLYYIDMNNNYSLMRYNTANRVTEKLIDGRCVHYNLYGTKIFAMIEGSEIHGIYRMNADGSQKELIAQGDFNNISCTSQYTFFQYYNDNVSLYRVPTMGNIKTIEKIEIQ